MIPIVGVVPGTRTRFQVGVPALATASSLACLASVVTPFATRGRGRLV
ncbi:MAG: hypothetical protein AAGA93_14480 [Actinomycetota bacterium]